ncbi:MAG: hypothetical protein IT458_20170 [Planctomycetes bacterium]|nr:hypothetical protein [Planctomycetota bacterium]
MDRAALVVLAALAGALPAQVPTGHYLVLTTRAPAGAALLDADPATGTHRALRRFAADGATPLACTWDPVARHAIVALAVASGTELHRVDPAGPYERHLATLRDPVIGLELNATCDLYVVTGGANGAIWELARNGATPRFRCATPHATALGALKRSPYLWLGLTPPSGSPSITGIDADSGTAFIPPTPIPALSGRRITGVYDLPTGAIREVVTDDQGGIHLFEFLTSLRTLAVTPPLPAGACVDLMVELGTSIDAVVLGDARHPYLTRVPVFGGAPVATRVAGPLAGSPVGADLVDSRAGWEFGRDCGWAFGSKSLLAPPGGTGVLEVQAAPPNAPALAVIGASEQVFAGGSLPFPLPGGCALLVAPDLLVPTVTDASGLARLTFAVPANLPRGFAAYAQWVIPTPAGLATTSGLSMQIEP